MTIQITIKIKEQTNQIQEITDQVTNQMVEAIFQIITQQIQIQWMKQIQIILQMKT